MSSSKKQSLIMTGIGLIILSAVMLYFGLSQPRISESELKLLSSSTSVSAFEDTAVSNPVSESEQTVNTSQGAVSFPININTCTVQELTAIQGIGEARAQAIIQYREHIGSYTSVEQIKDIKGFGDVLYEKVAPYLTV